MLLLGDERFAALRLDAWIGTARVVVARDDAELRGAVGSLCTLLAVGGPARGVTTERLRYPLRDAVLHPGSSWGVSNELLGRRASVALSDGTLLAVQPLGAAVAQ